MLVKTFWHDSGAGESIVGGAADEGSWFVGRIVEVSPCDPNRFPESPWNSLVVSWNGGNA